MGALAEHRFRGSEGCGWVGEWVSQASLTRAMVLVNIYYCMIIIRMIGDDGLTRQEHSRPTEAALCATLGPSLVFPFHLKCREFRRLREEDVCERIGNLEEMMNWRRSAGLAKRSNVACAERCFMRERS